MKYNFSEITVVNVDGEPYSEKELKPVHKIVGNHLYNGVRNVDLVETAMIINRGKPVELKPGEAKEIRALLCGPQSIIVAFVRKAIGEYMDCVEGQKK